MVSGENSLPGLQMAILLLCPHVGFPWCAGEGEKALASLPLLLRRAVLLDQRLTLTISFNLCHPLGGPVTLVGKGFDSLQSITVPKVCSVQHGTTDVQEGVFRAALKSCVVTSL